MTNPIIDESGTKCWYNSNRELHREDGPAMEFTSGSKVWFKNGKLHREDGPAMEWLDGDKDWYINGEIASESEKTLIIDIANSIDRKFIQLARQLWGNSPLYDF
jgi:hypothetical protein